MSNYQCRSSCYLYDRMNGGCAYRNQDPEAVEMVEPGEPCLHQRFIKARIEKPSSLRLVFSLE